MCVCMCMCVILLSNEKKFIGSKSNDCSLENSVKRMKRYANNHIYDNKECTLRIYKWLSKLSYKTIQHFRCTMGQVKKKIQGLQISIGKDDQTIGDINAK